MGLGGAGVWLPTEGGWEGVCLSQRKWPPDCLRSAGSAYLPWGGYGVLCRGASGRVTRPQKGQATGSLCGQRLSNAPSSPLPDCPSAEADPPLLIPPCRRGLDGAAWEGNEMGFQMGSPPDRAGRPTWEAVRTE